jgi:hypothetical protein
VTGLVELCDEGYGVGVVLITMKGGQVEEVEYIEGMPESESGPAVGWMRLGGLTVCLTRSRVDNMLEVSLESTAGELVDVRIIPMNATFDVEI